MAEGMMTPPPAPDLETCRTCPVQKPCWTRWGRTLRDDDTETTPVPGASEVAEEALKLEKSLRAHRLRLDRIDPTVAVVGPNVVRYKLALREGEAIARVEKSARDVQRDMGWPVPPLVCNDGKHVALDAPRRDREVLPWRAASLGDLALLQSLVDVEMPARTQKLIDAGVPQRTDLPPGSMPRVGGGHR